jgi:hypothetical protein
VFDDAGVVVVAHNTGMVAAQSAEFRRAVKDAGGSVKVAKNKLVQLAIKDHSGLLQGSDCRRKSSGHVRQGERQARHPRRRDGQDGS